MVKDKRPLTAVIFNIILIPNKTILTFETLIIKNRFYENIEKINSYDGRFDDDSDYRFCTTET